MLFDCPPIMLVLMALLLTPTMLLAEQQQQPAIIWVSTPVQPNETVMIQCAHHGLHPLITIRAMSSAGADSIAVAPLLVSNQSVMMVVPDTLPPDAYNISIRATVGGPAAWVVANAPDLWWAQGDGGESASPGGWLRVFGRGLSISSDAADATGGRSIDRQLAGLAKEMQAVARRGNWHELRRIATAQSSLLDRQAGLESIRHEAALATTLTLTPVPADAGGTAIDSPNVVVTVTALASNVSSVDALFNLPTDMKPGEYTVCVSNGPATGCLDTFISPTKPVVKTVRIKAAQQWPSQLFLVNDHGCVASVSNTSIPINCTHAVLAAIAAAGAAGGGVVKFGIGRYYLQAPLALPHNVRLIGAGMGKTAIYFSANNQHDVPMHMIYNVGRGRYGVEDLDIYITAYLLH